MATVKGLLRAMDGMSLTAIRSLFVSGSDVTRSVVAQTLYSAHLQRIHSLTSWDLVRAFPSERPVTIIGADWSDGGISPLERYLLAHLVRYFEPRLVLEVGTYRGATTALLLENVSPAATIYTMDLPTDAEPDEATDRRLIQNRNAGPAYRTHPRARQVVQILGDTRDAATWEQVPAGIDFAFIDASHSYAAVKNDTEHVWPKLSPDAVVLWHDYSLTESAERGVGRYAREQMRVRTDVFVCSDTSLLVRIPESSLREGQERIPTWFPAGDYRRRHPRGGMDWLPSRRAARAALPTS